MADSLDEAGFLDHLEALRSVLLKILLLFVIGCVPGWYFSDPLLKLILHYAAPAGFPSIILRSWSRSSPG